MVHIRRSCSFLITAVLLLLIIAVPVSAYNIAIYGSGAGLDPTLHTDTVTVIRSIPGSAGSDLDAAVTAFTQPSVDVIILGGDNSFSAATASKIEAAVAEGKILVVTYPCNQKFGASLPATNGGTAPAGKYLEVADPSSVSSKAIFAGLPTQFTLQGSAPDKEQASLQSGSVSVLNFDNGMPALIYGKYGRGYVIEWTAVPAPSYMDATAADTILDRLITRLIPVPTPSPSTQTITTLTTTIATISPTNTTAPVSLTPVSVTPSAAPSAVSGDVTVYSSPLGASILIDGVYYGTTPANLTGIPQGNHIIRLTQTGFYDYEGTLYVVPGQTSHAFGTLIQLNQVTAAATAVPIIIPVVTVAPTDTPAKGLLDNTSVIVAIIGVITASIAAGATIFTHVKPPKKE
jgi:hypothetical protein